MAVIQGTVGVSGPPEVDPVVVELRAGCQSDKRGKKKYLYLVIRDENHAGSKGASQAAVWQPVDLVSHAIVSANVDGRGGPPLGYG